MRILGTFLACLALSLGPAWPASMAVLSGSPVSGGSSIIGDAISAGVWDEDSNQTYSFNHSQGALVNGYVVVGLSYYTGAGGSDDYATVTYDGVSMTRLGVTQHATDFTDVELWGLAVGNKGSGTYAVVATFDIDPGVLEVVGAASSWNNVHQTTSTGTYAGATGTSTAPTVNVSSASNEIVTGVVGSYNGTLTAGAGQTILATSVVDGTDASDGAWSSKIGSTTTTFSYTKGTSGEWAIGAVPLKPASP